MRYPCIVEQHVCQKYNNNDCRTTMLLWQNNVTTVGKERQQCVTSVLLSYTCQKCNNNDCRTTMLLWQNNVSTVGKERQQCVTSVLLSYTSVKNVTVMSVAQQCFYGKLMLPATIRRT